MNARKTKIFNMPFSELWIKLGNGIRDRQ